MTERQDAEPQRTAQRALHSSPVYALRQLRVDCDADLSLRIQGHVSSFYHKQLAQEAVRAVAPGVELINSVDVG